MYLRLELAVQGVGKSSFPSDRKTGSIAAPGRICKSAPLRLGGDREKA
jgi:hypothetical protein